MTSSRLLDAAGNVVIRRQFKRRYVVAFFQKLLPCLVGIEACATSEHMAAPTSAAREKKSCQPGAVHTWHNSEEKVLSPQVRLCALSRLGRQYVTSRLCPCVTPERTLQTAPLGQKGNALFVNAVPKSAR